MVNNAIANSVDDGIALAKTVNTPVFAPMFTREQYQQTLHLLGFESTAFVGGTTHMAGTNTRFRSS